MQLIKPATAGTLESSDVRITLQPYDGKGIEIEIESIVKAMFGDDILRTVLSVLNEFDVKDAFVQINDKGALDHVIRSRMQAVICRSAEHRYDWSRED